MKILLKIIFAVAVVYFALILVLKLTKICPPYINLMPEVISGERPDRLVSKDWIKLLTLDKLRLCPFAEKIY